MVDVQDKLDKGFIQAKVIIEIGGTPKEYVENTLKEYVERIKQHNDYTVLNTTFEPAKTVEGQEGMFLAFVDVEMLAKDLPALTGFCFDYMPSSIEIIAPTEMNISAAYFNHIMNDLQGKLHKLDMGVKSAVNENKFVQKNLHLLLTNLVFIVLGKKGRSLKEISTLAGMEEKDMNIFLEGLMKKGLLKKEGDLFLRKNE